MATAPFSCFAIAAPGLEPLVARELAQLGEQPTTEDGGVSWRGDARSLARANLWLRTPSRVLVRVARFRATAFHELERHAQRVDWNRFVAPGREPEFRVTAHKSRLYHSDAVAQRLERAAGGRSRARGASARRQRAEDAESPVVANRQLFVVRVVRDVVEISADASGELLHRRGYREATAKAPLRETLAAALLLAAGWPETGAVPLVDPFCGSGTISIEGALLARRIAPGKHRSFAFLQWPGFPPDVWTAELDRATRDELPHAPAAILGSDRDAGAVEAARSNAVRAGVAGDVSFAMRAVSSVTLPDSAGLIATNPPYGVRVGQRERLRNLYAALGNVMRAQPGPWRAAMYVPGAELARATGLAARTLFRTSNGGIRVSAVELH